MRKKQIGVIGSGTASVDSKIYKLAFEIGKELVDNNFRILCGGLGGVMEAVCKGAKTSSNFSEGMTVGIVPSLDSDSVNSYVDISIASGISFARNQIIAASADAIVSISGGSGTLSEISFSWSLNKPIVALITSGGWSEKLANTQIDSTREDAIYSAQTPEEVIELLHTVFSSES